MDIAEHESTGEDRLLTSYARGAGREASEWKKNHDTHDTCARYELHQANKPNTSHQVAYPTKSKRDLVLLHGSVPRGDLEVVFLFLKLHEHGRLELQLLRDMGGSNEDLQLQEVRHPCAT